MRPIDGDKLAKKLEAERDAWGYARAIDRAIRGAIVSCLLMVRESPTISTESLRHGHWINNGIIKNYPKQDIDKYYLLICSECGCMYRARKHESEGFINVDFCPKCGAKMDGGIYNEN